MFSTCILRRYSSSSTTIVGRNVIIDVGMKRRANSRYNNNKIFQQRVVSSFSSLSKQQVPSKSSSSTTTVITSAIVGGTGALLILFSGGEQQLRFLPSHTDTEQQDTTTLINWSGTHVVDVMTSNYYEPETINEVEYIVRKCHRQNMGIRPLGSALSPNGIGFSSKGMIKLDHLDKVIGIEINDDKKNNNSNNKVVRVQAGARVSQVIDELRKYNLTLPNLASIAEQQMGGFIQVGAHGTGIHISPMDHYVRELKIITPSKGLITLSEEHNSDLFHLVKVGLGCFGIIVELTMDVIPAHNLVEHTFVLTRKEAKEQLDTLLTKHKHMRYMWIPHTDCVVCVTNDPEDMVSSSIPRNDMAEPNEEKRFAPLKELLLELDDGTNFPNMESMNGMGFGELRDALLMAGDGPLNVEHVKRVNQAEAEFWKRSEGYQTKPSDELLQFDCGGQQWVWEVCFSTRDGENDDEKKKTFHKNTNDMDFVEELLARIENDGIPAHAPIEQRWTASSSSKLSPAYYDGTTNGLFSWVGIIQYLPNDETDSRRGQITNYFKNNYCNVLKQIGLSYQMTSHWAKLERPISIWESADLQIQLRKRFGDDTIKQFQQARMLLDPKNILSNPLIDLAFGKPKKK